VQREQPKSAAECTAVCIIGSSSCKWYCFLVSCHSSYVWASLYPIDTELRGYLTVHTMYKIIVDYNHDCIFLLSVKLRKYDIVFDPSPHFQRAYGLINVKGICSHVIPLEYGINNKIPYS